jgi:hypothetical protein
MESRTHRVAVALLLIGAAIYVFKFVLIAVVGSEETWAQHVEGLSFVIGTPLQLIGIGMATWLATRGKPGIARASATVVAVVGWFLLIGLGDEVVVAGVELEWPLVVWAGLLVLAARAVTGLARAHAEGRPAEVR